MRNLKSVIIFLSLFLSTSFVAQNLIPIVEDPEVFAINKLPARSSFFAYENLKLAIENQLDSANNFITMNGFWKFKWSKSPEIRPKEFYKTNAMKVMTKNFSKFQDIFDKERSSDTLFIVAKKI